MIQIAAFWRMPDEEIMQGILNVHDEIFQNATDLERKIVEKHNVLVIAAIDSGKVVGYKIGYEQSPGRYYSWYGAVQEKYRGKGIASKLMKKQHQLIAEAGYSMIETKTRNKWKEMLILNIQHGFDIVDTFVDSDGIHRITMEKTL
ncbi:GNAT family N-acetyltransferase [Sporosarcina contaminans]|uniref:GNAT family N-acetyltransferase n=1 Tax=Sporosarcina contaminans TaxID=633403 RepID=A0ABW3U0C7_9BACL